MDNQNIDDNQLIEQTRPLTQEVKLKRVKCNFIPENSRFLLDCDFSKQYSHYYNKRLEKSKPFLEFNCRLKWSSSIPILTLAKLASIIDIKQSQQLEQTQETTAIKTDKDEEYDEFIIVGTIFKRMKLQPDVIQELSEGFHLNCDRYFGHYVSQEDKLVLEDSDETIALVGNIEPSKSVTGIVVAVLGYPVDDGSQFYVKDVCYAEPNWLLFDDDDDDDNDVRQEDLTRIGEVLSSTPIKPAKKIRKLNDSNYDVKFAPTEQTKYLMVVSAFGFHQDMAKESTLTKALQDLINFVWGAGKYVDDERSSQVVRILVVGDCLLEDRLEADEDSAIQEVNISLKMKLSRQVKPYSSSVQAVKHMDDFFAQLSKTINVDIMPGPSDPSSHLMPQQPFHPCMFPKSCMFPTFNCITNPSHGIYNDNVVVFATSGQNIDIISKFSNLNDPIEIMKCHLNWGNCAPSAPDNLYSVPYEDDDPHVIDFIPTIYIAGCQDYYRREYYYYSYNNGFFQQADKDNDNHNLEEEDVEPKIKTEKASQETQQVPVATISSDGTRGCDNKIKGDFIRKDRTLLITVPKFYETFSCVLINLTTLESHLMSFK